MSKKKSASRIIDSSISVKESDESAERTQAELKKPDPADADGRVIAKLLDKDDK